MRRHQREFTYRPAGRSIGATWQERRAGKLDYLLLNLHKDAHPFESMVIIKRIEASMAREVELDKLMAPEAPVAVLAPRPVVTREMTAREFVLACEAA